MKLDSSDTIRASPNCVCACRPPNYPCIHTHTHVAASDQNSHHRPTRFYDVIFSNGTTSSSFHRLSFRTRFRSIFLPTLTYTRPAIRAEFRLLENRTLLRRFPVCRSILSMQIILPPLLHNGCRSNDRTLSRGFVARLIDERILDLPGVDI